MRPRNDAFVFAHNLLDEVAGLVARRFYDRTAGLAAARLARRRAKARSRASATSEDEAIDTFLSALGASHTARLASDRVRYFEALAIYGQAPRLRAQVRRLFPPDGVVTYEGIGLCTSETEGRVFADEVYDGGPASRAGILRGDELLSIDGGRYREVASFAGRADQSVCVSIRRKKGAAPGQLDVRAEHIAPDKVFASALRDSVALVETRGCCVGYLRAWSYGGDHYHSIISEELATGRLRAADALVLDLRGGWGGASAHHVDLFAGVSPTLSYVDRRGREHVAEFRWSRPVVALIDSGTRSGKEVLAYALQRRGVILVGQPSAGAVLGAQAFLLSDSSLLLLATHDVLVDGQRLERRGVTPDIFVPFELPYAEGRDPIRAAGIEAAVTACR